MATREEAIAQLTGPGGPFEIRQEVVLGVPMRVYAGGPRAMRDIVVGSRQFGDRPFLVWYDEHYSYADHFDLVAGLAHELRDNHGVGHGDRVAIAMRNYPEFLISFWATQALGAVAVPLNAWWTGPELEYGLRDSGAKVLFADGERLRRLDKIVGGIDTLTSVIAVRAGDDPGPGEPFEEVAARLPRGLELPEVEVGIDDDATIMYTSGTTGRPKGAVGTQRNHITNLLNTLLGGAAGAAIAGITPDPDAPQACGLQTFPFFHIGGLSGLYISTAVGSKLVLMYKWDVAEALDLIEREGVTSAAMVPTLLRQLLESPSLTGRDVSRLGAIASGGAAVPPDLIRRIESDFASKVSPANGYGLTETTSAVVANSGPMYFEHPDSVGLPAPTADLRIVDLDGNDVPDGEIGELWFRGPNVVRGYWNQPEATAAAFTDGWFHTGDLGRRDEDGFVYVVDRIKDVVIRGGENVYCAEVEAVLFEHPAVLDVAIIGVPHRSLGEEVAAVVQLREGASATAQDLQRHVAERLATFKVPSLVVFRDEPLPRNAAGKVLKRELRDEVTAT
ncbi:MAG TPA: class I adenylate-forming enzyme family protein [Acidimicrobiales bacterium]|nr:class I adenylate-forming enzyme family protein [Acidimicrobiales bacterium]